MKALAPDMMLVVEMWGLGFLSPTEAALSATGFLCSKFHYIRVQQALKMEMYLTL